MGLSQPGFTRRQTCAQGGEHPTLWRIAPGLLAPTAPDSAAIVVHTRHWLARIREASGLAATGCPILAAAALHTVPGAAAAVLAHCVSALYSASGTAFDSSTLASRVRAEVSRWSERCVCGCCVP